jgi:hypothetical protein
MQRIMSANFKPVAAAASPFTSLIVTDRSAVAAAPAPRHSIYCQGRDFGFTSLAQCNATASGLDAECSRDVSRTESIPTREVM